MELEEVKEYFKNAKEVVSAVGTRFNYDQCDINTIHLSEDDCIYILDEHGMDKMLYDSGKKLFAEIISYKKDAQRIKEDCELLDKFAKDYLNSGLYITEGTFQEKFKKENGLIIELTELDKLKQSHAELMEKAEEIKQQMDKLK